MMNSRRLDFLAVGSLAGAAVATAAVYPQLPERIATHFDVHGRANGFMPRLYGAWALLLVGVVVWALVRFVTRLLPVARNVPAPNGVMALVASMAAVFIAATHLVVLRVALEPSTPVNAFVFALVGVFFVALGLVLPRVRRNAFVGFRTPWTLASDDNWARTHRFGGAVMVVTGLVTAVVAAAGGAHAGTLVLAVLLVGAFVPVVYSMVISRRTDA
jgi:uncharacterized membrane protein